MGGRSHRNVTPVQSIERIFKIHRFTFSCLPAGLATPENSICSPNSIGQLLFTISQEQPG
jgi:hypothetical protein